MILKENLQPNTLEEAIEIQEKLRSKVITNDQFDTVNYVAGVDVGFPENEETLQAAIAVLSYPDLQLVTHAIAIRPLTFPYRPGFLSFREIPAILDALEKVTIMPDLILCDGQGLAHPRRFGLACHLGVLTNIPSIGVAKSLYMGSYQRLPQEKGSWTYLEDKGEIIGAVVRSRNKIKPIYISVGHKVSLNTAINYTLNCLTKYRLPETTRHADKLSKTIF